MNGKRRTGPDPVLREQLARLAPPPAECEIPAGRRETVRELLMQELRTTPTGQPKRSALGSKQRVRFAVAAAITAASAVAVSALTGLTGNAAAWAVEAGPGDTITVRINEFRDPQGLERRLRAEGIPTIVDYIPPGKACSRDGRIWFDSGSVFGKPSPRDNDTKFQIRRGDVGANQALNIFAVTVAGQHDPAVFTFDVVPASTPHCDLTDATLPTARPGPSSIQSSSNPTPAPSR